MCGQHSTKTLPIEIEKSLVPEQAATKPLDLPTAPEPKVKPAVSTWVPDVPSVPLPAAPTVDAAVQPASYRSTELILLPATDE
ncbi:MAG: hypothetical protein GXP24_02940 [Planctomycetes bacterium]|nr:hypothetical protein [Planctomycetota bacterium]